MIYESIITTVAADGSPHIAPFGVQWHDGAVMIAPFRPSTTLQNIEATGTAVLNLTDDVRVFAAAIAKKTPFEVSAVPGFQGVRLPHCLAYHALRLQQIDDDPQRPKLWFKVEHSVQQGLFMGFNRAQAAVIELAVLVSRLHLLPMEKITQEMQYLQIAIDKTAGERELQAWQWLVDCVQNFQAQHTGMQQA